MELTWSWSKARHSDGYADYYRESFSENTKDVFFCQLNEIEPNLEDDDYVDSYLEELQAPTDPRRRIPITSTVINDEDPGAASRTHSMRTRYIKPPIISEKALKNFQEVLYSRKSRADIQKPKFKKATIGKNGYCGPDLHLLLLSMHTELLKIEVENLNPQDFASYTLQSAIPFTTSTGPNIIPIVDGLLFHEGLVPEYPSIQDFMCVNRLKKHFTEMYEVEKLIIDQEFVPVTADCIIPFESLILFISPKSIAETWEIPFSVEYSTTKSGKLITFDNPLPLRSNNIFMCNRTLEKIFNFDTQSATHTHFMDISSKRIFQKNSNTEFELHAVDLNQKYELKNHDEYMARNFRSNSDRNCIQSHCVLRSWKLESHREGKCVEDLNLITKTPIPYFCVENDEIVFVNTTLNIQCKRLNGTNSLPKEELINEWLKQFLISSGTTKRVRVNSKTFDAVAVQNLSLPDIERELLKLFNIQPMDFLGALYSSLKIIQNFPFGRYLLKFNPRTDDKLMIYTATGCSNAANSFDFNKLYSGTILNETTLKSCPCRTVPKDMACEFNSGWDMIDSFPLWIDEGTSEPLRRPRTTKTNKKNVRKKKKARPPKPKHL